MFNLAGLAILFTAALSVAAMPSHFARNSHNHREIAARVPQPEALPVVEVAARDMSVPSKRMLRRRGGPNGRCNPPASSSPVPSPTPSQDSQSSSDPALPVPTPEVKGNIGGNPDNNTPSEDPKPSTPTPDNDTPTPTPTPSPTPTPTSDSPTPTPTPTSDSGNNSGNSNSGGGQTYSGQGTFYSTGLGACGITNNDSQFIAAVSHDLFDSFPGYDGNPNHNPICGKTAVVTFQGKTISVQLTDRCEGCQFGDLDFSPAGFNALSDPSAGRIGPITWFIQ